MAVIEYPLPVFWAPELETSTWGTSEPLSRDEDSILCLLANTANPGQALFNHIKAARYVPGPKDYIL